MIRRGISGGLLSVVSLLDKQDRTAMVNNTMIRTSSVIREAAKIGLQSLYANADEVLEKYKDFDIIKEMKSRKGANLLWVKARAIDADICNTNGDYFSKDELTKDVEYQGKRMPAYKTFEGVPIYTNHKNDNIEEAKGMVVYAEWDDEENCVYCVFFIDEDAYPDIARGIRQGYIHDVSMGCSVDEGICSICGNKATTEKDYCDCLKKYKGKMHPSGKRAFEYNYGIKFIELSCVGDGAFESCEILELYDQEELLAKAKDVIKVAQSLNSSISLAAAFNEDVTERREVENALRQLQNLNREIIRIAQTAGTLVGGQLMGGGGAQNATVVKILQGLGIDPSSQLNILDLVNLSLNFLEVAVLNLFSRKDNIDLAHVAKLTKAMGELQNTLQDMIDDGVETGGQRNTAPMIPPQQGGAPPMTPPAQDQAQGQAPAAPTVPQMQASPALFEQPSVGSITSPFSQQPYIMPLGGGVSASKDESKVRFVWASTKDTKEIEEVEETRVPKLNKIGKLAIALDNLREACEISKKNVNEEIFIMPQKDKTVASSGDKKIMDHFKKIAQDLKKANSVSLAIDIKLDDQQGNRVVLSTDKGIKGFHKGQLTNWSPNLSDAQISQMESGDGYRVAADLLKDFSSVIKTAEKEHSVDHLLVWDENLEPEREDTPRICEESLVDELHKKPQDGNTYDQKLDARRKNKIDERVQDEKLEEFRTDELVRIVTTLAADAKKGLGTEPLEEMLHPNFGRSTVPGREVMSNVVKGIAKTCVATKSKPEDVINFLTKLPSKEFAGILKIARLGTAAREYDNLMSRVSQAITPMKDGAEGLGEEDAPAPELGAGAAGGAPALPEMPEEAIKGVADTATPDTTEGDIMKALEVIKDNFAQAVEKLDEIIGKDAGEEAGEETDDMKDALSPEDDVDQDALKGAVTGLSLSGEETGASPDEMVDSVNSTPVGDLSSGIDKARSPMNSLARARAKATKTASKQNLSENLVGWLADMANHYNVSSEKMALATKLFCSYEDASKETLRRAMKTAEVRVVDETTHATTLYATLEDIGTDVKDAAFNERFRDFAVDLLSRSGYEVDPNTFALTDIDVSEDGMVTGKVSSRSTKAFVPDEAVETPLMGSEYVDPDRAMKSVGEPDMAAMPPTEVEIEGEAPVVMSASAKTSKRMARLKNVIKIAQGIGLPGAPAGGAGGGISGPVDPAGAGMAGGGPDLGLGSLTGASPDMGGGMDSPIEDSPEPGNKSPWGTICPQCGSKDVDVANGEGTCNSCNAQLKFKFIVEVSPAETKAPGEEAPGGEEAGATPPPPPVGGPTGAPEAGMGGAPGVPPAPTPAAPAPGAPAMASNYKVMTRIAYRTSADVYASALSDGFNKDVAQKLPVGMICPSCGSREASKRERNTYCYNCGTISVSEIKSIDGEPGELEATIVYM